MGLYGDTVEEFEVQECSIAEFWTAAIVAADWDSLQ